MASPSPPSASEGSAPPRETIKLTGGIEIECLLVSYHQDKEDGSIRYNYRKSQEAQVKIYEALKRPMRLVCVDCKSAFDYHLPLSKPPGPSESGRNQGADIDSDNGNGYTKWAVSMDESLDLSTAEYRKLRGSDATFHVAPIEIKSRVLPLTQKFIAIASRSTPGHAHMITYHEEIEAVYARLHVSFNSPRSEAARNNRLVVNDSASTHVHIGSDYHGFPLDTVKNVMSIVVANELQFDSIHAADRITGTDRLSRNCDWNTSSATGWLNDIRRAYNVPWSEHLIKSAHLHYKGESPEQRLLRQSGRSEATQQNSDYPASSFRRNPKIKFAAQKCEVPSWLTLIEGAKTVHDISRFQLGESHNSTVNLSNLREQRPLAGATYIRFDGKMTIEFRQHGGTLQATEILSWVGILVKLLQYANTTEPAVAKAACLRNWDDPTFDMLNLLKVFGFRSEDDIFRHYMKVLGTLPNVKPYAEIIESQELAAAEKFGRRDRFIRTMKHLIKSRAQNIHPDNVRGCMTKKFQLGGYGQFSEAYLVKCTPEEFPVSEYLKLGFCPPWSDYQE